MRNQQSQQSSVSEPDIRETINQIRDENIKLRAFIEQRDGEWQEQLKNVATSQQEILKVISREENRASSSNDNATQTSSPSTKCISTETETAAASVETQTTNPFLTEILKSSRNPKAPAKTEQQLTSPTLALPATERTPTSIENSATYGLYEQELSNSMLSLCFRFAAGQASLKECSFLVQEISTSELIKKDAVSSMFIEESKKRLRVSMNALTNQKTELLQTREVIMKAQKNFKKILSDYDRLAHELSLVKEANEVTKKREYDERHKNVDLYCQIEDMLNERNDELDKMDQKFKERKVALDQQERKLQEQRAELREETVKFVDEKKRYTDELNKLRKQCQASVDFERQEHADEKIRLHHDFTELFNTCTELRANVKELEEQNATLIKQKAKADEDRLKLEKHTVLVHNELGFYEKRNMLLENQIILYRGKCDQLCKELAAYKKALGDTQMLVQELSEQNAELKNHVQFDRSHFSCK